MTSARIAIRHPITTFMLFAAVFILGLVSLSRVALDLFPDVSMPTIAVYTVYPGVGPYEVESGVTKPIEEALNSVNGIEQTSSTSAEGVSMVIANFDWSKDMDAAVIDVREAINSIEDTLPEGAERPGIFKFNPQFLPSLIFNVYTETRGIDVRRLSEKQIVPRLEKVEGVGRVDVFGGAVQAVICRLDLDEIGKLEIPLSQVLQAFQGENIDLPGGAITINDRYLIIRTIGEFGSVEDIGHVLVGYRNGVPIFLKDLASISVDALRQEEFVRAGGADGVVLAIRRQAGHNTVVVNDAVKIAIDELTPVLPRSIKINITSDQSTSVLDSIGGVATAAWQGGLLAIFVLLFFLRNIRSTLIIAAVIPASIVATFSLMDFGGLTMNMVSLMGITLGVGMFVDNSIVVLESSYRKQLAGLDPEAAAIEGTSEVGKPIIASTLTTVAVFVPMLFVEGIAGLIFDDLSMTISFALLVSLVVALTLIPLLSAKFLRIDRESVKLPDSFDGDHHELSLADIEVHTGNRYIDGLSSRIAKILVRLDDGYERIVTWALRHSVMVVSGAVILLGLSLGSILLLGLEFLPETDEGQFDIYLETKIGSSYEATTRRVISAEEMIREVVGDDLVTLTSQIGQGGSAVDAATVGSNLATITVNLTSKDQRRRSIWEIINQIDAVFSERLLGVRYSTSISSIASLATSVSGESSPVVVELRGDDLDELYDHALVISDLIEAIPGTRSVNISHTTGKPELQFRVKRREALSLGLSPYEIALTVRAAFKGATVTRYSEDDDSYDVVVMLEEEDKSPDRFSSLFFVNPAGARIPLENLVEIEEGTGPLSINRFDRTRYITVTAALTGDRALNRVVADLEAGLEEMGPAPLGIERAITGASQEMADSFSSMFIALVFAVVLVYMVMASQFESLLHPFVVMFSVPFAVIGLVMALIITNTTFSLLSFVGGILLVGIVVNNAIVLIDYMNLLRERGVPLKDAIVQGGKTRLKPILMTTLTTIFGMLPMSLGIGAGSEIRAPMGRAIVGGLTTSTVVTLVLIPVIYWLVETKIRPRLPGSNSRAAEGEAGPDAEATTAKESKTHARTL